MILILVGLAVVASFPTTDSPRSRAELLQLILSASPEDNHISDDENIHTEEDVLTGQDQIYVSKAVQGNTNNARQPDQVHSESVPQQEDADAPKKDEQEQVPEVEQAKMEPEMEQAKTEPEVEQIQEQSNPEVKEVDQPNLEIEQSPPELVEQINKQQIPESEYENVHPEAEVDEEDVPPAPEAEQVPLEPYISLLTATEEAERDSGIIVVGQEDTENEPYLVDKPVMVEFPEAFEPQDYPATQKEMTDLFRRIIPYFYPEENEEPQVDVLEESPSPGPYSDFDIITEPEEGTQIDEYSPEIPVIIDASGKPEDVNPDIPVEEDNEENPEFNTPDIVPEHPVLLKGEDVVLEEDVSLYITNPVLGTDSNNPTEIEGPSDEPPLHDNGSLVAFFIPSHETPTYDDNGDETPFEMAPREELFHDQAPEEEFFHEGELFQVDAPEGEFFNDEAPEEEFFHEEAPEEGLFHFDVPEGEFSPDEAPEEEFFHEVPEGEFFHDEVPEEEFFHDEVEPQVDEAVPINEHLVIEEMSPEFGSDMFEDARLPSLSEDAVYIPEGVIPQTTLTVSEEGPTDEADTAIIYPKADYFFPEEDGPKGELIFPEIEVVPDDAPIIMIEEQLHSTLPFETNGKLSPNPTLLEPQIRIPFGGYGEFRESVFPFDMMEDSPRPIPNKGEPFFITGREEPPSNFDSDAVDIFVIDGPKQNSEATSAAIMPIAAEQVFTEEQPVPIAEYLEQPVPIAEYSGENYHDPIIVQSPPYRIPSNYDNDRIIFPDDTEPHRSLPIFPHEWDEDSHSEPLKEQQMPQREDMQPMKDDIPPTLTVQSEVPQDIPDFTNQGIPRDPISTAVPLFEPNQERDDINSETYVGPTMFQKNFQVPLSSQQNLKYYNTIRRTPSADYTFPQHSRRSSNFPEHFHGPSSFPQHFHEPSSFPQHFHGPVSHTHPFSRPEIFSDMPTSDFNVYDGPKDFHPQFPTGPKSLVHKPIMHYEPFFGPSGEPPLREHSPLLRTSSMPVTFDNLNQHEPQLNIDIYPMEMPFTPDESFDVSSYSNTPKYPAFNFPHRPYFRTQHSPSYGDPIYIGPVMYPATGLYPPTRTHSRYAPNFVTQQNNPNPSNPYPTPTW